MKKRTKKEVAEALEEFKKAAREGRVEIGNAAFHEGMDKDNFCTWVGEHKFGVEYSIPGFGFGSFCFGLKDLKPNPVDPENIYATGKLVMLDSECMSRDFVKAVLCKMVDECEWDCDEKDPMRGPYAKGE
jgi:hypothetical protein